jgi:hypothetical protein
VDAGLRAPDGRLLSKHQCFVAAGKADCIQQGRYYILWRIDGTPWQIARVFSCDHRTMGSGSEAAAELALHICDRNTRALTQSPHG